MDRPEMTMRDMALGFLSNEPMIRRGVRTFVVLGLVVVAAACQSSPPGPTATSSSETTTTTEPCDEWRTTLDISMCLKRESDATDTSIRLAIAELAPLDPITQARLDQSQQTWEDYRAAQCTLEAAEVLGGREELILEQWCRLRVGKERLAAVVDLKYALGPH